MFKKLVMCLLCLNLIAAGFIIGWTWKVNEDLLRQSEALELLVSMELKNKKDNEEFRGNIYKAAGLIMSGQSQIVVNQNDLNMGLLRIHHFVEPHSDKFYKNCPECQIEREAIEQDSITLQ